MDSTAVAQLMGSLRRGNQDAARQLADIFYPELRRLAAVKMKQERAAHTWQPTVLVNELYLELVKLRGLGDRDYSADEEKTAFLNLAGAMMHRLLIHHARPLYKRVEQVRIDETAEPSSNGNQALAEVENALTGLAAMDPKLRTVVEMKVFEGLTGDQIAERLGCSRRTVANYWDFARNWLRKEWAGRTNDA